MSDSKEDTAFYRWYNSTNPYGNIDAIRRTFMAGYTAGVAGALTLDQIDYRKQHTYEKPYPYNADKQEVE